jgi:hypothetical protein
MNEGNALQDEQEVLDEQPIQEVEIAEDQLKRMVETGVDEFFDNKNREDARSKYFLENQERLDKDRVLKSRINDLLDQADKLDLDFSPETANDVATAEILQRADHKIKIESIGEFTDEQLNTLNANDYKTKMGLSYNPQREVVDDPDGSLSSEEYARKYNLFANDDLRSNHF